MHSRFVFRRSVVLFSAILTSLAISAQAQVLWTVGLDDNGWPFTALNPGDGGGPDATFVQEAGVNALPGSYENPETDQQGDDEYYISGIYNNDIPSNGD